MRSPYESLVVLRSVCQELDPHAMKQAVYHHMSGSLPSSSFSDGRGSADPPFPGFDPTDAELVRIQAEYDRRLDELANLAVVLRNRQRDLLYIRPTPIPKAKVLADLELEDDGTPERLKWCASCARAKMPSGGVHHAPIADERHGGKEGVLCRWCLDFQLQNDGKWPPLEFVQARAEGRRVRVKVKPA